MPRCILCLNERELTERHILPFSMGESSTHKLVCESCNKVIDKAIDAPFLNSILPQLPGDIQKLQRKESAASNAIVRFGAEWQMAFNFGEGLGLPGEQLNTGQNFDNDFALESIKVAYILAALEFGNAYVMNSPVAGKLRKAISSSRRDEISFKPNVDLGPLTSILSAPNTVYLLLFHNACMVSVFGSTFTIEYCLENEVYVHSINDAVLYVFNPIKQSHQRHLLADYLVK